MTTLSGTITSFNNEDEEILIQLIPEGEETPLYEVTVKGNTAEYSITDVVSGTYTMRITKAGHVIDEYAITAEAEVIQNVTLRLKGDATSDNAVGAKDVIMSRRSIAGGSSIEIDFDAADVTGDSVVNAKDVVKLRRYISGGWDITL